MFVMINMDWDELLFVFLYDEWLLWVDFLSYLESFCVLRSYSSLFVNVIRCEVFVFCDVLKDIIVVVVYFKFQENEMLSISFLFGKVKVVFVYGYIIFWFELCVVVLVIEIVEIVRDQLNILLQDFYFFLDSQIVFGYILNESCRFYVYVGNRVVCICFFSMLI